MSKEYVYWGTLLLDDGSEVVLDLEEHGWAEKSRLARTRRFALVPKDDAKLTLNGTPYPPVVVNIPENAKPVFKTRVKGASPIGDTTGRQPAQIRLYGIGYKLRNNEPMVWVLPTGAIEVGEDSLFADLLLRQLTFIGEQNGSSIHG